MSEDPSEQFLDGEEDESSEEPDEYEDDEKGIHIVRGNKKKERPVILIFVLTNLNTK